MSSKRKKSPVRRSIDSPASTVAVSGQAANQQDPPDEKITIEGEPALANESNLQETKTDTADVNSNRQSKSSSKPSNSDLTSDSFPQEIKIIIAKLNIVVDHFDSPRNYATNLILELARLLDEERLCERDRICRKIKEILKDKIQAGKITKEWISECLPEHYKRKYTKSESKLRLLSKQDKDKDTEPATDQGQTELAAEQEPQLKREVLVQVNTSGQSIQQQQSSESDHVQTEQQPGESERQIAMPEPEAQSGENLTDLQFSPQSQSQGPAQSEPCQCQMENIPLDDIERLIKSSLINSDSCKDETNFIAKRCSVGK
jgi:hypothetical protein